MSSALGALLHSRLVAEHHNPIVLGGADVELVVKLNKRDKWKAIFSCGRQANAIFTQNHIFVVGGCTAAEAYIPQGLSP